ncbi:MAG: TonB-dependent receptor, partial [Hyphomicrobiaceae bacterium]
GNFDIVGQLNGRWSNDYKDGDGNVVPGSNDTTKSGFLKARWRLAPGHTLTGTYIGFNSKFEDQVDSEGALRDTAVNNRQMTLGYTFTSPSNPLIDFNAKVYKNTTELEQIRKTSTSATQYDPSLFPFFPPAPYPPAACAHIPGSTPIFVGQGACSSTTTFPSGSQRSFNVDTVGFDVHNTSRLNWGSTGLALTYGGDLFRDRVNNFDPFEAGDELTPSGERQVSGAFIQAHLKMFDTVDVIGAMRYDSYQLESNTTQNSGERVSPKATIGYTPLPGFTFFTTYAEGYRAPAVTETLISGVHVPPANFSLLPNPDLRPEVAHNLEAGLNVKLDGVIMRGDSFRAKFVAFRNKIEDYIDTVFIEGAFGPPIFSDDRIQYQNINKAKLEGVEIEAAYDARQWFFGLAAHRIRGINEDTGAGLYNAPADQVTLTGGFRAFDEKLIAGARVKLVAAQDRFAETFSSSGLAVHEHSDGYALLDLFGQYQFNENAVMNLNIDNVFDKNYRQHLDQYNSPGLRARLGMTVRLGG